MGKLEFEVSKIGPCRIDSPMKRGVFVRDDENVIYHSTMKDIQPYVEKATAPPAFEVAGPRKKIFFDPSTLTCGLVTCGGLCPGINDVIRAIVMSLHYHYGVRNIFGFRYGFGGLSPHESHPPIELTPELVVDIHQKGGTILGSSRGPQDVSEMVDTLERMNIGILFTIGGDGTLRGANAIYREIRRRGLEIGVIAVPKTIDNDISHVDWSFGFHTSVYESRTAIYSAHEEAQGAENGIGLVKLMGRHSGWIAAYSALANGDVNYCLVPEVPFSLERFLESLRDRLERRHHAVIIAAEGAGQDLVEGTGERDASGNIKLVDIGLFLKKKIAEYFDGIGMVHSLKYIDPSYIIRSMPANAYDSAFCLLLGHNAVHAGMAGRTNMVVGNWKNEYTHIPIPMAVSKRKSIEPKGRFWSGVLSSTGQPRDMS